MPSTPTLIRAPGETLADALHDLLKIANATYLAAPFDSGIVVVRREDDTVVAAFVDPNLERGFICDEQLLPPYTSGARA